MTGLQVDKRPRCKSRGLYSGLPVPCDLHRGHDGKHQWARSHTSEEYEWTDEAPYVKAR